MKVMTTKTPPEASELIEILKREFFDKYSYRSFGAGKEKSIIVQKSTFVGAQITRHGREFTVQGIHPTVTASLVALLLQVLGNLFILFSPNPYRKLEKEIAVFLSQKYK
jgi:hypothetical protein